MATLSINHLFQELIQISVGASSCLSVVPSSSDWYALFTLANKQTLIGVFFYAIQRLPEDQIANLPIPLKRQWMAMALMIQRRNDLLCARCLQLQELLFAAGYRTSTLKGQGIAKLYGPLCSYRQSGDIDVFIDATCEEVVRYAISCGDGDCDWDYKHVQLNMFEDVEVEAHYVPEIFMNPWKNRRLQKWFHDHKAELFMTKQDDGLIVPSIEFDLFFILLHAYRHYLTEGVGLRQLMDYYFVLKDASQSSRAESIKTIRQFGMMRFMRGTMWIMQSVFHLEEKYLLCEPDMEEGRYILNQIMRGGNFGYYDDRIYKVGNVKWNSVVNSILHAFHLLFHYPSEVFWSPIWIIYHFFWKRIKMRGVNQLR